MGQKTNWKKALWDKLSDEEIRKKLESLPEESQATLLHAFNFYPHELRKMGWREVCAGCGALYDIRDCGCPAGSAWRSPEDALE